MDERIRMSKENMKNFKYPKGEIVWESYYNTSQELKFIITSKKVRDCYFIYEFINGEFKKLGKARTPPELVEKYDVLKKIGVNRV